MGPLWLLWQEVAISRPFGGRPRDVSAPGVLEGLTGLRPGLESGSGLSPHMRGYNLNEGSGEMR